MIINSQIEEENEPEVKAPILRSVLRKPRIIQRVSETKDLTSSNEDLYTAQVRGAIKELYAIHRMHYILYILVHALLLY